jgi:hypothetical protein
VPLPRPRDAGAAGLRQASAIEAAVLESLLNPEATEGSNR